MSGLTNSQVRERTGDIPVGYKLKDIDAAPEVGVDYIILDGRGGATGAAPTLFGVHISVPTIPAPAPARRHLHCSGCSDVTLIITGGLRTPADFVKTLALGAKATAVSNAALQAIAGMPWLGSKLALHAWLKDTLALGELTAFDFQAMD